MAKPNEGKSTESALQAQIAALQAQVAQLSQLVGVTPAVAPRYPMWSLIRDFLRTTGGSATPLEIAEGLLKQGHKLGKYPLRNVKITVTSPMMKSLFRVTENATGVETVTLIDRTVRYTPKKWVDKKPVRRSRR